MYSKQISALFTYFTVMLHNPVLLPCNSIYSNSIYNTHVQAVIISRLWNVYFARNVITIAVLFIHVYSGAFRINSPDASTSTVNPKNYAHSATLSHFVWYIFVWWSIFPYIAGPSRSCNKTLHEKTVCLFSGKHCKKKRYVLRNISDISWRYI